MSKCTRGLLAVILAVVLVLPAAAFAMLPEANARSSTGMDGPTVSKKIVDPDTSNHWKFWAGGYDGKEVTTQNVGRIWTDKTVKETAADEKSDFLTTLSAISSTSDTTVSGKPLDIVLVLDASGSMDDPMGGGDSTKRIKALKSAANNFIDTIAGQNEKIKDASKQHQVAIVKFAGKRSDRVGNDTYREDRKTYNYSQTMQGLTTCSVDGAKSLKETVNSIAPAGATHADYGLQLAEGISSNRADAKKIVVFFTDGSPTSSNGFEHEVAKDAINTAKTIKSGGATIYTIGIFSGAKPSDNPTNNDTSNENKFMHAVSSNYPNASSSVSYDFFWTVDWSVNFGDPVADASYYKSATNAAELEKIFEEISGSIIQTGYPTEVHGGYGEHKSGYITFTDRLGDFMQVDDFTSVVYNGETFTKPAKKPEGNVDTYQFEGAAANLVITVQHAAKDEPQAGDIVTVKIPASLIPLRHFKIKDGVLTVDNTEPVQVSYTSSVKKVALDNLFTPEQVVGLEDYIKSNTTTAENRSKTVNFYANKWKNGALGDTIANFEPAESNRYYYFQKQTPIYVDESCTTPAKGSLAAEGTYYYKDEFEAAGAGGKVESRAEVIEFTGGHAAQFEGAVVPDTNGNLSFSAGTARLAFIDELHTTKERVGGNLTGTATDVLNPKWNNTSAKSNATEVDVHLGNNGKISYKYDMTSAAVDTKASFGLTKVLEGREWTGTDEFKFELSATSDNNAPMPDPATVTVTNANLDDKGKAAINFGKITYAKPGEYTYEVREVSGKLDGITYSDNVATFKVTVTVNAKGELKADVEKTSGETEFTNTYTAEPVKSSVTDKIEVTKTLTGRALAEGEFSFELREIKGEDSELIETAKNDANGNVAFSATEYTKAGEHTYTLREVKGNAGGVTYDKTVHTVVTTITDNGKGQLVATHKLKDADNGEKIEFKNAYNLTPKDSSVTHKITAYKSLTGRDLKSGEFEFELVEGGEVVATGKNSYDGMIAMSPIEYTEPGEHTYTLREVHGGTKSNGITYDSKTYTIVTTVTDNGDGTLDVHHVLKGDAKAAEFNNDYGVTPNMSSVTDQIAATKTLTGRKLSAGEFSFELVEGDEVVAEGTNAADGKIVMDKITYDKAGEHTYILREAKGAEGNGITYDDKTYTVVTTITDNGKGKLVAKHELKDAKTAEFKNSYKPNPGEFSVTDQITATKSLAGRDMTAGEFSFELVEGEGEDAKVVATGKNDADGNIKMGAVKYDKPGTHTYTLREVNGGTTSKGIAYDGATYTIVTTITDKGDGALEAKHELKGAEDAKSI